MVTQLQEIRSTDWQVRLSKPGEIVEGLEDIRQSIGIILTTPRGSDPHRPEFACDIWKYLDRPTGEAVPNIIREATRALRRWEPRIDLVRLVPTIEYSTAIISVEFRLTRDGDVYVTEVRLAT